MTSEAPLTKDIPADGSVLDLAGYEHAGGYQGLRRALKMTPKDVQEEVKNSGLRGRGGAGFPTGLKWSFVPAGDDAPHPRYVVANGDEMEPGTFKDRHLMEGNPHQLIEGLMLAGFAIQADTAFIFLRGEYKIAAERIEHALADSYAAGYLGKNILGSGFNLDMHLHISAGRYMCGEETGLLNALEGKRANPRAKPPFPQVSGLFGKPTVVNNVETLSNLPHILHKGADWFKTLTNKSKDAGTKIYGASGKVKRPGLWELPMGTSLRELFEEYAGGMRDGLTLRGLQPGGASTDFLTPEHLDIPMDFDGVSKAGSRLGTGMIIVLDDKTCPVGMTANLTAFFAQESCGWCTPCWSGLGWSSQILEAIDNGKGNPGDLDKLQYQTKFLAPGHTFCALAPGAAEPLQSALKYFREDFERHIKEQRCPWRS